jgi:hypothetical protein
MSPLAEGTKMASAKFLKENSYSLASHYELGAAKLSSQKMVAVNSPLGCFQCPSIMKASRKFLVPEKGFPQMDICPV